MRDLHQRMVAHYIEHKVEEIEYFLLHLLAGAVGSLREFREDPRKEKTKSYARAVIFGLSAFTNAIQSLKDTFTTATGEALPWSTIHALRHGQFFHGVRNAASHDGNPLLEVWIEGQFWSLHPIVRYQNSHRIEISAKQAPVPTLCLEFAEDLCNLLLQLLARHVGRPELRGDRNTIEKFDAIGAAPQVPESVRSLFITERARALEFIENSTYDPIQGAIERLTKALDAIATAKSDWDELVGASPPKTLN